MISVRLNPTVGFQPNRKSENFNPSKMRQINFIAKVETSTHRNSDISNSPIQYQFQHIFKMTIQPHRNSDKIENV